MPSMLAFLVSSFIGLILFHLKEQGRCLFKGCSSMRFKSRSRNIIDFSYLPSMVPEGIKRRVSVNHLLLGERT